MGKFRKKLANQALGQDIDQLCLAWFEAGMQQGVIDGVDKAVQEIVTELLSDVQLSLDLDIETLQRIVKIIEN